MSLTSDYIVDNLYLILTSTTSLPDLYTKRCGGFRNEKEIEDLLRTKGYQLIDGGQLIFVKKNNQSEENKIFYYTVTTDEIDNYTDLYKRLSQMEEIKRLFFIKVNDANWSTVDITVKNGNGERKSETIPKPNMTVYEFVNENWNTSTFSEISHEMSEKSASVCKAKDSQVLDYMRTWNPEELKKVYCNRYVLDVELNRYKKNMMDFDAMILHDGNYVAIESKEKDPIGKWTKTDDGNGNITETENTDTSNWSFGWDTRRYSWYYYLKSKTGLDTWFLIREVDNQTNRNFVKWKKIDIEKFSRCAVWHFERQTGRGSTIEASYDAFVDF